MGPALTSRACPRSVWHFRPSVPRLPHLRRLRRVLLCALPARRPALPADRHARALPHPGARGIGTRGRGLRTGLLGPKAGLLTSLSHPLGLCWARLGGPHLLFALLPLPDGTGTEDPRVKCPPPSFPFGPAWPPLPPPGRACPSALSRHQKYTHNKNLKTNSAYIVCLREGIWVEKEVWCRRWGHREGA